MLGTFPYTTSSPQLEVRRLTHMSRQPANSVTRCCQVNMLPHVYQYIAYISIHNAISSNVHIRLWHSGEVHKKKWNKKKNALLQHFILIIHTKRKENYFLKCITAINYFKFKYLYLSKYYNYYHNIILRNISFLLIINSHI